MVFTSIKKKSEFFIMENQKFRHKQQIETVLEL